MISRRHLSILALAGLLPSCGTSRTDSIPSKVIGQNDLLPVVGNGANLPEKFRTVISAIGLLEIGCTVSHIGDGLIVTAAHCIPQQKLNPNECLSENFAQMIVHWNYREGAATLPDSTCLKPISSQNSEGLDYAILLVDHPPPAKLEVELNIRPAYGSQVTLFGYPQKRPLEWSQFCSIVELPADFMTELQAKERKNIFAHQCDTEVGNSGSPVIDSKTLKIIGIHHGGIDPWNTASWVPASPLARAIRAARPLTRPR